jgi:FtsH-binding integral membrane protein
MNMSALKWLPFVFTVVVFSLYTCVATQTVSHSPPTGLDRMLILISLPGS